jgi:hypothetical protein
MAPGGSAGGLELLSLGRWKKGATDAAGLGYVPLPPALVAQVKDYWVKNLKPGTEERIASREVPQHYSAPPDEPQQPYPCRCPKPVV